MPIHHNTMEKIHIFISILNLLGISTCVVLCQNKLALDTQNASTDVPVRSHTVKLFMFISQQLEKLCVKYRYQNHLRFTIAPVMSQGKYE